MMMKNRCRFVRKALEAPLYQIVSNAGGNGDVVVHFG
jgi:chaperonin GroEL (HSP60 family)